MNQNILSIALATSLCALISTTAYASPQWVNLNKVDDSATFYIDINSIQPIREHANWKTLSLMIEPKATNSNAGSTVIIDTTINCTEKTGRIDEIRLYDQPKAQGNLLNTIPGDSSFLEFDNDPSDQLLLATVCK